MKASDLGMLVSTKAVNDFAAENKEFREFILRCVFRYLSNDWGDLHKEDKKANDDALKDGDSRILASYNFPKGSKWGNDSKLWIITEWDHSVTTLLFSSDY